ncbi:MAG TPA: hypothetical protein VF623_10250 [Segetibacter sp.]|jgi:hypothetical protein
MKFIIKLLYIVVTAFIYAAPVCAQKNTLLNGTLLITLVSNDTIWLGADSRTSALTDTGYRANKKGMCKINSTNDIVYAMAGHVRYVDNSFNFLNIMRAAINKEKDFEKSMQLFELQAKKETKSILKKFSRKSINTLIKTNNGSFLSVVAISFVNGEKKIKEMKFSIEASGNNWNVVYKETEDIGVGSLRFVGHGVHASQYVKENNLYFGNGQNVPNKIVGLIKIESTKGTTTVGMPADVISIYDGGFKRVITSGLCD